MPNLDVVKEIIGELLRNIYRLNQEFPHKAFTLDGRLVGDIGEILAEAHYDLELYRVQVPVHDGVTSDGRRVQVKATFQEGFGITQIPDYLLALKLNEDGSFEEVFNGPMKPVLDKYGHWKDFGSKQKTLPVSGLKKLAELVSEDDRVPRKHE